jgi:membrane protein required for beta-lactamase induction
MDWGAPVILGVATVGAVGLAWRAKTTRTAFRSGIAFGLVVLVASCAVGVEIDRVPYHERSEVAFWMSLVMLFWAILLGPVAILAGRLLKRLTGHDL